MDLSELIDEIREIKIYETDPKDWMGVLEEDDYWEVVQRWNDCQELCRQTQSGIRRVWVRILLFTDYEMPITRYLLL